MSAAAHSVVDPSPESKLIAGTIVVLYAVISMIPLFWIFATSFKTPTLVVHGQLDYRLDVSEGLQLFTTLQRLGVPSKMLYFPDEGHWVQKPQNSQLWYKTVNDWVDQWCGTK